MIDQLCIVSGPCRPLDIASRFVKLKTIWPMLLLQFWFDPLFHRLHPHLVPFTLFFSCSFVHADRKRLVTQFGVDVCVGSPRFTFAFDTCQSSSPTCTFTCSIFALFCIALHDSALSSPFQHTTWVRPLRMPNTRTD